MICAQQKYFFFALCALFIFLVVPETVWAQDDPLLSTCVLNGFGDCCTITLNAAHSIRVSTNIDSAATVNFVVIRNKGKNSCAYLYDGEIKTLMQSEAGGYNGTWLGGDFSLRYQNDANGSGSCQMDIYYMAIGNLFPDKCQDGHFRSPTE
jgi:hypothetical protein